jgi:hypothetical protein
MGILYNWGAHTMYKLVESNDIIFLLSWFQNLFTAPSFGYFCCFVQSLMGLEKEGFVTNVYLSSNSKAHWTNFHRFLSRYRWSTVEVSRRLLWLLLKDKKEKRIWANCWVFFGLLFQFGTSWLFFPISALLYVRKNYIKVTSEFKTKLELGKQIIENLELPDWIHLTRPST